MARRAAARPRAAGSAGAPGTAAPGSPLPARFADAVGSDLVGLQVARSWAGSSGPHEAAPGQLREWPVWHEPVMWVSMSAAEREEFLAGVHVGVLSAAVGTAGRTLVVPVWYSYQPGGLLTVLTGRRSRKAAAIRAAGRFSLCVQDDSPPYRYVSVEGPVVGEEELDPGERLAMARRYLGAADGDRYVADNPGPGRENVAFRMRPEHWLSQDQGKGQAAG